MNISNRQHDSSVPPDTKESSLVELRGAACGGEISDLEVGFEAPPARSERRDRRGPGARCRRRGSAKPYLTMSACIRARSATGTRCAVERYKPRHVLALLIVCVCGWRG